MAASMDAMAVIDGKQHIMVNQPYVDLYGFSSSDELVGEVWIRHLAEDERTRFEEKILPACSEDGQWRGTIRGQRRYGEYLPPETVDGTVGR